MESLYTVYMQQAVRIDWGLFYTTVQAMCYINSAGPVQVPRYAAF